MRGNSRRCAVASQGVCRNETVASTRFLIGPRVRPIDLRVEPSWPHAPAPQMAHSPFPMKYRWWRVLLGPVGGLVMISEN